MFEGNRSQIQIENEEIYIVILLVTKYAQLKLFKRKACFDSSYFYFNWKTLMLSGLFQSKTVSLL